MSKHPSRWRTAIRRLGRSTALIVIAALLFLANVVVNLFSTAIETPLKAWLGDSRYSSALAIALVVCLILAAVVYWYEHRGGKADQESEVVSVDPEIDRRNRQVFINDMRWHYQERLESAPKIIRLRLAERAGAVEQPGALIRPYDIAYRRPGQPDELLPARARLIG